MFTIGQLCDLNLLTGWIVEGDGLPVRSFIYTDRWLREFNELPTKHRRRDGRCVNVQANLAALIDRFVDGTKKSRLVRPFSEGSDPVWRRMRKGYVSVIEFRTWDTRTFGFFSCPNVYVATSVGLADQIKANNLYEERGNLALTFMARVNPAEINGVTDVEHLVTD